MALNIVWEGLVIVSRWFVRAFPCTRMDVSILTTLMSQIVRKDPSCLIKDISGQTVVTMRRMGFMCVL